MGYAYYPPHVPIINEVFGATAEAVADADHVIAMYERAAADGRAAVTLESGRTILAHDYQHALNVRARAATAAT